MKTIPKLAILLFASMGIAASAAERITDYAFQTMIEPDGEAPWYLAEVPVSVQLRAAHADLRDLRVFNAEGESLPFALTERAPQAVQGRREAIARLFPLYSVSAPDSASSAPDSRLALDSSLRVKRDAKGGVEIEVTPSRSSAARTGPPRPAQKSQRGWLLDAGAANFPLEHLSLDLAADGKEGFFQFSVEASDDLEHWRFWTRGQLVRLSFDGQDIHQREIGLPGGRARYLRLIWDDAEAAAGVRGIRLSGAVTGVKSIPLAWSQALAGEAAAEGEHEFIWHLPVSLPLLQVRIALDEANTLAPVILSGRDFQPAATVSPEEPRRTSAGDILRGERRLRDALRGDRTRRNGNPSTPTETPWRTLASGVVYRLPADVGERVENELGLPGSPVNQLRLRIDPRGSGLGAGAPRIELGVRGWELCFLARGSGPYRLAVGRADAQAADLPLSTLIPGDVTKAVAAGQLGRAKVQEPGPGHAVVPPSAPPVSPHARETQVSDTGKTMLWAILVAGVILLGGMVFSLSRSMKKNGAGTTVSQNPDKTSDL